MRQSPSARDRRCQGAPAAGGWLECSGSLGHQRLAAVRACGRGACAAVSLFPKGKKNQGDMFVEIRINGFWEVGSWSEPEVGRPQRAGGSTAPCTPCT